MTKYNIYRTSPKNKNLMYEAQIAAINATKALAIFMQMPKAKDGINYILMPFETIGKAKKKSQIARQALKAKAQ